MFCNRSLKWRAERPRDLKAVPEIMKTCPDNKPTTVTASCTMKDPQSLEARHSRYGGRFRLQRIRDLIGRTRLPFLIRQQGIRPDVRLLLEKVLSHFIGKDFRAIQDVKKVSHLSVGGVGTRLVPASRKFSLPERNCGRLPGRYASKAAWPARPHTIPTAPWPASISHTSKRMQVST